MGDIISDYGLWDGKFFITNVDKSNTNIEPDEIHIDQEIVKYAADLPLCRVNEGLVNHENFAQWSLLAIRAIDHQKYMCNCKIMNQQKDMAFFLHRIFYTKKVSMGSILTSSLVANTACISSTHVPPKNVPSGHAVAPPLGSPFARSPLLVCYHRRGAFPTAKIWCCTSSIHKNIIGY